MLPTAGTPASSRSRHRPTHGEPIRPEGRLLFGGPVGAHERQLERRDDRQVAHPPDLVVAEHQGVLDAVAVRVVVGARQGGLVGIQDHVVSRIPAGVGGQLPAVVVERPDEVGEFLRRPVHVTEKARRVELRLGQEHLRRRGSVGEELDATDPQARAELLPRPVVTEPDAELLLEIVHRQVAIHPERSRPASSRARSSSRRSWLTKSSEMLVQPPARASSIAASADS